MLTAEAAGPLNRSGATPPARTLIDIPRETAQRHPEASALEDEAGALSYRELLALVWRTAARLREQGVRRGDRVGVRMPSGDRALYIAILGVMAAGAAYVPVDADDPQEWADLVFGEAAVRGVVGPGGEYRAADAAADAAAGAGALFAGEDPHPATHATAVVAPPTTEDDAWIIFTSGSTGVPKGVAVSHRSATAFVDAEARLFLESAPLGPGDRVLAGLSVAFDASCEEMWLAWRHGACLVPAPRALVRSGEDLGPWLVGHGITVVSTVPTLAALWPQDAIENLRLLIFGGEALPPELAARLASDEREVWNTYGPTEATVACAALMDADALAAGEPVRIGLPLDGWALAVVDAEGSPVAEGEVGELIIGGVGLARYLDPAKDAEKYAPMPALGWERAYRSGDLVRADAAGLVLQGRADDQVKIGGRRIELGEVESALQALTAVSAATVVVQRTEGGVPLLVGYVVPVDGFDRQIARAELAETLPAPLIPVLAVMDELPVRTSGKVDKAALPWPLEGGDSSDSSLSGTAAWLAEQWLGVLGIRPADESADFFQLGGGSLAAAQLVSRIRARAPEFTMADVYDLPRLGQMAAAVEAESTDEPHDVARIAHPTPRRMQWVQTLLGAPLLALSGARWIVWLLAASWILQLLPGFEVLPDAPWWAILLGILVFATPFGRMAIAAAAARLLLGGVRPGDYPRGGGVHLRLWLAEQIAHQIDPVGLAGAPWVTYYARALGARIGEGVDLHTLPPVTGMLQVGAGAAIEPEVDPSGYWIDGDTVRIGGVRIGAGATIGSRSTLAPGARIGRGAEVAPGSAVFGRVRAGQRWAGSPAVRVGGVSEPFAASRPAAPRRWLWAYAASSLVLGLLPFAAVRRRRSRALGRIPRRPVARRCHPGHPAVARAGGARGGGRLRGRGARARAAPVDRPDRGRAPGPQPGRVAGVDGRAPSRLGQHAPVPDLLQPVHARVAAAARRPRGARGGGLHGPAHPVDDDDRRRSVPRRRHHGRDVRAAGRLDAPRGRADRKARVPRELGPGGRGAPRAQGRPGGRALGRAREGEGGLVVARIARCAPAPGRERGRPRAHLPPAHLAAGGARPVGAVPLRARGRHVRARRRGHADPWPGSSPSWECSARSSCPASSCWRRARSPRPSRRSRSGRSWAPSGRASIRCGRASCGGPRSPTRSPRCSRRRGSRTRRRARRRSRSGSARSARGSDAACGPTATGCRSPTSSHSATAPR